MTIDAKNEDRWGEPRENQKAARAAGWHIDRDGWWTRPLRAGDRDPVEHERGFLNPTKSGDGPAGPYFHTAAHALRYDGLVPPNPKDEGR